MKNHEAVKRDGRARKAAQAAHAERAWQAFLAEREEVRDEAPVLTH